MKLLKYNNFFMIWILLKLIFSKWLSIKRWNNFPRIEDITPLDNAWFVIHISLFLAHLEENNWKEVDKEYIIKKILFSLFNALVLSDINSWTRDYILNIDKKIMSELEDKVKDFLFSFSWDDFIKQDMKDILSMNDRILEDNIILAAKKFAWYQECLINSRVFLYAYDVAMDQIRDYLEENKSKLYSLRELLKNDNYKNYLSHIRRLSHSMRWSGKQRIYQISVMSHLTIVTFISYIMWSLENKNWWNYEIYDLMIKWAYHDIPEAITWDIITPIKNSVDWFREVLEKVEEKMMNDYFFIYVWDDYKKKIRNCMLDPFSGKDWELVKQADIISALLEAKIERDNWNMEFWNIYRKIKKIVNWFNSYSANYFLKDVLLNFWEDLWDINLEKLWK